MRIDLLFSGAFWGVVLILLGVSAICKAVFNIHFPFFRVTISVIIIYVGLCILFNGFHGPRIDNTVLFGQMNTRVTDSRSEDLSVIFGQGKFDLTQVPLDGIVHKEISVVFGQGDVLVNSEMPIKITASSAFAGAKMPDNSQTSFGEYVYKSKNFKEGQNYLDIEANVVFGQLNVYEVTPTPVDQVETPDPTEDDNE